MCMGGYTHTVWLLKYLLLGKDKKQDYWGGWLKIQVANAAYSSFIISLFSWMVGEIYIVFPLHPAPQCSMVVSPTVRCCCNTNAKQHDKNKINCRSQRVGQMLEKLWGRNLSVEQVTQIWSFIYTFNSPLKSGKTVLWKWSMGGELPISCLPLQGFSRGLQLIWINIGLRKKELIFISSVTHLNPT